MNGCELTFSWDEIEDHLEAERAALGNPLGELGVDITAGLERDRFEVIDEH